MHRDRSGDLSSGSTHKEENDKTYHKNGNDKNIDENATLNETSDNERRSTGLEVQNLSSEDTPLIKATQQQDQTSNPNTTTPSHPTFFSFELLPEELVLHILSFLSLQELCTLSLVAKKWHRLTEDDYLWSGYVVFEFALISNNC